LHWLGFIPTYTRHHPVNRPAPVFESRRPATPQLAVTSKLAPDDGPPHTQCEGFRDAGGGYGRPGCPRWPRVPVELADPESTNLVKLAVAWLDGDGTVPVRSDLRAAVADAASAHSERGLDVINERPPGFEEGESVYAALRAAEGLPDHLSAVAGHESELTEYLRVWLARPAVELTLTQYRALGVQADSVRARVLAFMEDRPILLLPVASIPAFVPETWDFVVEGTEVARFNIETCCRVVTLLRTPAAVVPCGTTPEGLPIGVQVVGRPYRDHEVMAVAIALEEAFGRWRPPTPSSD